MKTFFLTLTIFITGILFGQSNNLVKLVPIESDSSLSWYDIRDLGIEGKGWYETGREFERLPAKAEGVVPKNVWILGHNTSGLNVKFVTDATEIHARWTLTDSTIYFPHFSSTGVSGLDLYYWEKEKSNWRWASIGKPFSFPNNSAKMLSGLSEATRKFMLYLPLYNGVSSVEIGIPKDAAIWKINVDKEKLHKPIVFSGTSITQGGCASRAGMSATAILGRRLKDYPIINLGFSGNGKMEPELADLLSEIDASLYVVDCSANMTVELIKERVEKFVEILRKSKPETPIILVEEREPPRSYLYEAPSIRKKWKVWREAYENLTAKGIKNLHYIYGVNQVGSNSEGTVDGSHPNDLGFWWQANYFESIINEIVTTEK